MNRNRAWIRDIAVLTVMLLMNAGQADTLLWEDFSQSNGDLPASLALFRPEINAGTADTSTGDLVLAPTNRFMVAYAPNLVRSHLSVRTQFRILEESAAGRGVEIVARGNTSDSSAYIVGLAEDGTAYVGRSDDNKPAFDRNFIEFDLADRDVVMQLDLFDNQFEVWICPSNERMPSEPMLTASDGGLPNGVFGVDYYSSSSGTHIGRAAFRYLHFADKPIRFTVDCNGNGDADVMDLNCSSAEHLEEMLDILELLQGDADGNGKLEFADFTKLASNFGMPGQYTDGDFDKDGMVLFADFLILSNHFGQGASGIASVPEGSSGFLLLSATMFVAQRRRRARLAFPDASRL